jgi:hypothetical protein
LQFEPLNDEFAKLHRTFDVASNNCISDEEQVLLLLSRDLDSRCHRQRAYPSRQCPGVI